MNNMEDRNKESLLEEDKDLENILDSQEEVPEGMENFFDKLKKSTPDNNWSVEGDEVADSDSPFGNLEEEEDPEEFWVSDSDEDDLTVAEDEISTGEFPSDLVNDWVE